MWPCRGYAWNYDKGCVISDRDQGTRDENKLFIAFPKELIFQKKNVKKGPIQIRGSTKKENESQKTYQ